MRSVNEIDVGMKKLHSFVELLPQNFSSTQADDIIEDIKNKYNAEINKPIINNEEIASKEESLSLAFPKIREAFIPQSYKSLAYTSKDIHLEDEKIWKDKKPQNDLTHYFIKYLNSPDSIEYPLIVLGHPGSGKSLLTKVLSAQLTSKTYTVIRIPLREVNPDLNIDLLVEEQIKKLTNRTLHEGYGGFAKHFKEKPLLIILDGYDELLQAKGDVFAGYLERARRFQQDQKELDRPVRVIVTSRITLIDKAIIPINSPILRLLEFTPQQQNQWIEIWNDSNSKYFKSKSPEIKPFTLPKPRKGHKNSILELAEQPLLLLMLALYDSENNSLAELQSNLKRTVLYENLLRRFIRRERSRYIKNFNNISIEEQNQYIDLEMKRLGVVAIGMYNRKKLCINTKELDNDLNLFELECKKTIERNGELKDSEALLGGFFFIHQSTAQDVSANSTNADSAFEFLHNTFGEFLTADIILRYAVQEINILKLYKSNATLTTELNKKLNEPNGLCTQWFNCLMFTPLFSRPVVLEMIKEHLEDVIKTNGISKEEFILCFKEMIQSQLKIILSAKRFSDVMINENKDIKIPLLGLISIYTLNLVILASVLIDDGFVFDETIYTREDMSKSETAPWDKLAFLWRTWFSSENLMGLSVIFNAIRQKDKIHIKQHDKYESKSFKQPIDIQLSVSNTLAEHLIAGLSGLHTTNFTEIVMLSEKEIADFWESRDKEIYFSFLTICLRKAKYNNSYEFRYENLNLILNRILNTVRLDELNSNSVITFLEVIESCCNENMIFIDLKDDLIRYLIDFARDIHHHENSGIVRLLYKIIRSLNISEMFFISHNEFRRNDARYIERYIYSNFDFHDRRFYKNRMFNERLIYDTDIQSVFSNTLFIDSYNGSYSKRELQEILSKIDFIEYAKCNPEFISKLLLQFSNDREFSNKYVKPFIELILGYLKHKKLYLVGFTTIINTIKLIKSSNMHKYMNYIEDLLKDYLMEDLPEKFAVLLISQPNIIIELLKLVPNIFVMRERQLQFLSNMLFEKNHLYFSNKSILAYIKLLKQFINQDNFYEAIEPLVKRSFSNYVFENIQQYTIDELKDIYWIAKILNNKKVLKQINNVLRFDEISIDY